MPNNQPLVNPSIAPAYVPTPGGNADALAVLAKTVPGPAIPFGVEEGYRNIDIPQLEGVLGPGMVPADQALLQKSLAFNQPLGQKIGNALLKVLGTAGITVLQSGSSFLDVQNWRPGEEMAETPLFQFSKFLEEQRERMNRNVPIYRASDQPLSFGDIGWWLDSGSNLTGSIIGFLGTGGIASIGARAVGKGLAGLTRATQIAKIKKLANAPKVVGEKGALLTQTLAMNHAEGYQIAAQTYNDVFNRALQLGHSAVEAEEAAAGAAAAAISMNRWAAILDLTSARYFLSPRIHTGLYNRLKPLSKKTTTRIALYEGAQESVEEEINFISQQIATSQALGELAGTEETWDLSRILTEAFTAEGLENALLGFIGGFGQTTIHRGIIHNLVPTETRYKRGPDGNLILKKNKEGEVIPNQYETERVTVNQLKRDAYTQQRSLEASLVDPDTGHVRLDMAKLLWNTREHSINSMYQETASQLLDLLEDPSVLDEKDLSRRKKLLVRNRLSRLMKDSDETVQKQIEEHMMSLESMSQEELTKFVHAQADKSFSGQIFNAAEAGDVGIVEDLYNKMLTAKDEELKELGLNPTTARAQITMALKRIPDLLENYQAVRTHPNKELARELFDVFTRILMNEERLVAVREKINKKKAELLRTYEDTDKATVENIETNYQVKAMRKEEEAVKNTLHTLNQVARQMQSSPDLKIYRQRKFQEIKEKQLLRHLAVLSQAKRFLDIVAAGGRLTMSYNGSVKRGTINIIKNKQGNIEALFRFEDGSAPVRLDASNLSRVHALHKVQVDQEEAARRNRKNQQARLNSLKTLLEQTTEETEKTEETLQKEVVKLQELVEEAKQLAEELKDVDISQQSPADHSRPITIKELIGNRVLYKGTPGTLALEGETVIFMPLNSSLIFEVGKIQDISEAPAVTFSIEQESSVVSIAENGIITVRGKKYHSPTVAPIDAIVRDSEGNVLSVHLETLKGKPQVFSGQLAEDIAYEILLKYFYDNSNAKTRIEEALAKDTSVSTLIDAQRAENSAETEAATNTSKTSRPKTKRKKLAARTRKKLALLEALVGTINATRKTIEEIETSLQEAANTKKTLEAELARVKDGFKRKTIEESDALFLAELETLQTQDLATLTQKENEVKEHLKQVKQALSLIEGVEKLLTLQPDLSYRQALEKILQQTKDFLVKAQERAAAFLEKSYANTKKISWDLPAGYQVKLETFIEESGEVSFRFNLVTPDGITHVLDNAFLESTQLELNVNALKTELETANKILSAIKAKQPQNLKLWPNYILFLEEQLKLVIEFEATTQENFTQNPAAYKEFLLLQAKMAQIAALVAEEMVSLSATSRENVHKLFEQIKSQQVKEAASLEAKEMEGVHYTHDSMNLPPPGEELLIAEDTRGPLKLSVFTTVAIGHKRLAELLKRRDRLSPKEKQALHAELSIARLPRERRFALRVFRSDQEPTGKIKRTDIFTEEELAHTSTEPQLKVLLEEEVGGVWTPVYTDEKGELTTSDKGSLVITYLHSPERVSPENFASRGIIQSFLASLGRQADEEALTAGTAEIVVELGGKAVTINADNLSELAFQHAKTALTLFRQKLFNSLTPSKVVLIPVTEISKGTPKALAPVEGRRRWHPIIGRGGFVNSLEDIADIFVVPSSGKFLLPSGVEATAKPGDVIIVAKNGSWTKAISPTLTERQARMVRQLLHIALNSGETNTRIPVATQGRGEVFHSEQPQYRELPILATRKVDNTALIPQLLYYGKPKDKSTTAIYYENGELVFGGERIPVSQIETSDALLEFLKSRRMNVNMHLLAQGDATWDYRSPSHIQNGEVILQKKNHKGTLSGYKVFLLQTLLTDAVPHDVVAAQMEGFYLSYGTTVSEISLTPAPVATVAVTGEIPPAGAPLSESPPLSTGATGVFSTNQIQKLPQNSTFLITLSLTVEGKTESGVFQATRTETGISLKHVSGNPLNSVANIPAAFIQLVDIELNNPEGYVILANGQVELDFGLISAHFGESSGKRLAVLDKGGKRIDINQARKNLLRIFGRAINVIELKTLVDNDALGAFDQFAIYLSTLGEEGTEYHEAFEKVFKTLLTPEQQQILFAEYKKQPGAAVNITNMQHKTKADESGAIIELLAEEFLTYGVQRDESETAIVRFFKKLWHMVKNYLSLYASNKQSLFDALYDGSFRQSYQISLGANQQILTHLNRNGLIAQHCK